jgi:hypothetical protein
VSGASGSRIGQLARDERLARRVGFWWGLAEGVAFFIVPDVYISIATIFSLRAGGIAWLASIAGSLVGILVIRVLTSVPGLDYLAFLERVPGISAAMIQRVTDALAGGGLPYTPLLVFGGVPLKVYAAIACSLGLPLVALLLWTAFARVVRIAPTFLLAGVARLLYRRRIDAQPAACSAVLAVWWVGFYVFYFARMSRI